MATLLKLLHQPGHDAFLSLQIAGFGPLTGADASTQGFRLSNRAITGATDATIDPDSVIPCLMDIPGTITERVNLLDGSTDLSSLSVRIRADAWLPGQEAKGPPWITRETIDSYFSLSRVPGFPLLADMSRYATALLSGTVNGNYPSVGSAYYLGAETIVITGVNVGGAGICTVARAMYGSQAVSHAAGNALYPHPMHLRGRRVWLRLNFMDPSLPGYVLPLSEELVIWSGTFEEWEIRDRGIINISGKSTLGRLDRCIGRSQWEGTATGFQRQGNDGASMVPFNCNVDISSEASQYTPGVPYVLENGTYIWDFYARIADSLCQCRAYSESETDVQPSLIEVQAIGCMGTSISDFEQLPAATDSLEIREVLPTDPSPRTHYLDGTDPLLPFILDGALMATSHPIDIALALLVSTGEYGANGEWDILPERWGVGIPEAEIDLDSWLSLRGLNPNLQFSNLIIGWEGKPFGFRKWLQDEILSPMGWYLRVTTADTISIGCVKQLYPGDTSASLAYAEVLENTFGISGGLPETISLQTWSYGWDWSDEKFKRIRKYISLTARDRLLDDDSEISIECKGIAGDEATGASLIAARSQQLDWFFASPLPRLSFSVKLDRIAELAIGDIVSLENLDMPIYTSESYGLIVSRGINLAAPGIDLEMLVIPSNNLGLWSPAGEIHAYDDQALTIELEPLVFTDLVDAAQFNNGDMCMLIDKFGVPLHDTVAEIADVTGENITLVAWPDLDGAEPAYIVYCRVDGATAPSVAWEGAMLDTVAMGDGTEEPIVLPDDRATYEYGA